MNTLDITIDNFMSTVQKPGIVLLDWWASWCGPCRIFGPIFEAAAKKHPDIVFGKVDTQAQPELARAFQVQAIPTVTAFRDGILVFAQPGMLPGRALDELIGEIRALDMEDVRRRVEDLQPAGDRSTSP